MRTAARAFLPPEVLLVLDAAYAEYVDEPAYDPGMRLVEAGDNTVMLRTFSKMFGLAGMRVGWAYAPPAVIDALNRVRGVFNVNIAAQAAAAAALAEPGWVERTGRTTPNGANGSPRRCSSPASRSGRSTATSFSPTSRPRQRAAAADAFLKWRGLIVRAMGVYDLPHCLRVTIGTGEECTLVADALATFMAGQATDA